MENYHLNDSKPESNREPYFRTKPLNKWIEEAKLLPKSNPLFGNIWHTNELAICFADTGIGKSILMYGLFDAITSNKLFLNQKTTFNKCLYFDFELQSQSILNRYSNQLSNSIYHFNENFIRSEINLDFVDLSDVTSGSKILSNIQQEVINNKSNVICVDNISFISTDNEKSRFATVLMKGLLQLSRKHGVSILVLAHEPKEDKYSNKLTLNRLAGSKALSNYADVIFALGKSMIHGIIYLKELKNRNREIIFHEGNVMVLERVKLNNNFLTLQFVEFDKESNLIDLNASEDRNLKILKMKNDGFTNEMIGKEFNLSEGAIRKILKKLNH